VGRQVGLGSRALGAGALERRGLGTGAVDPPPRRLGVDRGLLAIARPRRQDPQPVRQTGGRGGQEPRPPQSVEPSHTAEVIDVIYLAVKKPRAEGGISR
jgi:hypothetical protein